MKPVERLILVVLFALSWRAIAADPHIDKIEPFPGNQFSIHFNTEANRTYALQYTTRLQNGTNGTSGTNWVTIFTAPSIPFDYHYVITDEGAKTNKQRFYRLAATP